MKRSIRSRLLLNLRQLYSLRLFQYPTPTILDSAEDDSNSGRHGCPFCAIFLPIYVYYDNIQKVIDWKRITGFDWDQGNARKSADRHDVSQAEAEQAFFNEPLLLVPDLKHSQREPRFHALSKTDDGRLLHITFTLRAAGTLIRVISARDMHRKERIIYGQAKKDLT